MFEENVLTKRNVLTIEFIVQYFRVIIEIAFNIAAENVLTKKCVNQKKNVSAIKLIFQYCKVIIEIVFNIVAEKCF